MTEIPHRSYSQLSALKYCGEQYRLTRVVHAPEVPAWYLVGGKAVHSAIEEINLRYWGEPDAQWDDAALRTQWLVHWEDAKNETLLETDVPASEWRTGGRKTKANPNAEDGDWWQTNGLSMVRGWIDFLQKYRFTIATLNGLPAIEINVSGEFGEVPVKAYLDVLFDLGGELMLVDIKTGSRVPESTEQLGLYATLVEQRTGIRPALGSFYMARGAEFVPPSSLDQWSTKHFEREFSKADRIITEGLFLAKVGTHCRGCGVARFCAAYGGADAALYEEMDQ